MTVAKLAQTDMTVDNPTTYKANIDANFNVLSKVGNDFAPYANSPSAMNLKVAEGKLKTGSSIVEIAEQTSSTITAPVSNPRIDLVYIDELTGVIGITSGTEASTPSRPALPSGKIPVAEIALTTSTTSITNSLITDIRPIYAFPAAASSASESTAGIAEIATQTETNTGTDDARFITPAKLANYSGLNRLPTNYLEQANAKYASSTTYTLAWFSARNSDDDGDIKKSTSTTIDISTTGLNGIAQSANQTGTISCSGTTVTGSGTSFTTVFVVGDVIYSVTDGTARRITVVGSNTSLTVESSWNITGGTSFRRGGRAPNCTYLTYAITDGTTPGTILSTRSVADSETLVDLPSGYTKYRQMISAFVTKGDNTLFNLTWSDRYAKYYGVSTASGLGTRVLSGGNAISATDISLVAFMPKTSRVANLLISARGRIGANDLASIRQDGSSDTDIEIDILQSSDMRLQTSEVLTSSSRVIEYFVSNTIDSMSIAVAGFRITEV